MAFLFLETGSPNKILLESGSDNLLGEGNAPQVPLKIESGDQFLLETGEVLQTEGDPRIAGPIISTGTPPDSVMQGFSLPAPYPFLGAVTFNDHLDRLYNNSSAVPFDNTAYTVSLWFKLHAGGGTNQFLYESDAAGTT